MNLPLAIFAVAALAELVLPQQLPFEIPVQLIGFPIIIMAVRISNFLKKLSYAINPNTYRSRSKRGITNIKDDIHLLDGPHLSAAEVEKRLVREMGDNVCIYLDVCLDHAQKHDIDWNDIYSEYSKKRQKEFYLLSVFLGDIVRSPEVCRQLVKRGRGCPPDTKRVGAQRKRPTSGQNTNDRIRTSRIFGTKRPKVTRTTSKSVKR